MAQISLDDEGRVRFEHGKGVDLVSQSVTDYLLITLHARLEEIHDTLKEIKENTEPPR